MVKEESLEGFAAVYGRVEGQSESGSRGGGGRDHPPLPLFLFSACSIDAHNIRVCVSDFSAQTWQEDFSVHQLQNLRDEVGIGGSWKDFLAYVRTALSSENVKLILGEAARAEGGHGFVSARLVAQKAKGTPRLSLPLSKKGGSEADGTKGSISFGLLEGFLQASSALATEKEQTSVLRDALAAEKVQTEKILQQLNSSNPSFMGRKKQKSDSIHQFSVTGSLSQLVGSTLTQLEAQDPVVPAVSPAKSGTSDSKDKTNASAVAKGVGPITRPRRRNKRRGTTIGEEEDS